MKREMALTITVALCLLAEWSSAQIAFQNYASIDYSHEEKAFIVTIPNKFRYNPIDKSGVKVTKGEEATVVTIGRQSSGRMGAIIDRHVNLKNAVDLFARAVAWWPMSSASGLSR